MRPSAAPTATAVVGLIGLLTGALTGCAASADDLAARGERSPSVVDVVVEPDAADDGAGPLSAASHHVRAVMRADATAEEVMALFDAYDDQVEAGDVVSVSVTLEGATGASLASGEGVEVSLREVEDLVRAQADPVVTSYLLQDYPDLPLVQVGLAPVSFAEVVSVADRYLLLDDLESVTVSSGDLVLRREAVDGSAERVAAREAAVLAVAERFDLLGADVSGRGPDLEVDVAEGQEAAARRFLARTATDDVGRVVVR